MEYEFAFELLIIIQLLIFYSLNKNQETIMATQAELTAQITGLTTQVQKVGGEVQKVIDALKNQPDVTPELQAAVDGLAAEIGIVDSKIEDEVVPPPPAEEGGEVTGA